MLTLLGSVLGFVTSTGPGIFKQIMDSRQDVKDNEHELALIAQESKERRDEAVITSARDTNVAVQASTPVSYTHLRADANVLELVCRLLLEQTKH